MPAFSATPAVWTNSSDANFRAWGSYIASQLLACGLVQTGDTGQINWTTVLTPAGINTYQGYEIWRFNDALQASAPVFIKIEYGEGATVDGSSVRIQFGSGSNGAGTLTGNLSSQYVFSNGPQAAAVVVKGSGANNRFVIAAGWPLVGAVTAANKGLCFGFERSVDANGNPTTEAVIIIGVGIATGSSGGAQNMAVWNTATGVVGVLETLYNTLFTPGATMAFGTQVMVAPLFPNKGVWMNPGLNAAGYYIENIAVDGTPSVYMYGAAHVYYSLKEHVFASSAAFRGTGTGTESMLIRFE